MNLTEINENYEGNDIVQNKLYNIQNNQEQSQFQIANFFPPILLNNLDIESMKQFKYFKQKQFQGKFFIIKTFSKEDLLYGIIYSIWSSTVHGNQILHQQYQQKQQDEEVYLVFSVNGSGKQSGIAKMVGNVQIDKIFGKWSQQKCIGIFPIEWICIKDVANSQFKQIRNPWNQNKLATSARDVTEMPLNTALQMFQIIYDFNSVEFSIDEAFQNVQNYFQ